jgi:hypothetical protein
LDQSASTRLKLILWPWVNCVRSLWLKNVNIYLVNVSLWPQFHAWSKFTQIFVSLTSSNNFFHLYQLGIKYEVWVFHFRESISTGYVSGTGTRMVLFGYAPMRFYFYFCCNGYSHGYFCGTPVVHESKNTKKKSFFFRFFYL